MKSKIFKTILVLVLFALGSWQFYKHLFNNGFGVFNLQVIGKESELISTNSGELLVGDKVYGRFLSPYQNLGIVSVRFHNQHRDSDDTIIFRLKEANESNWYFQAKYNTDQFLPGRLFPFGFPLINDSENKKFVFELESLNGATGSGIYLDSVKPIFTATSFFNKSEIINDRVKLLAFIAKKAINTLGDTNNLVNAIIFFSPLFFFLLFLLLKDSSFHFIIFAILGSTVWDIVYLPESYDSLYLSVIFIWLLTTSRHRFESKIPAFVATIYVSVTPLFLIFNYPKFAEKTIVWAYIFLCISVFQQLYEYKFKPKKLFGLMLFLDPDMKIKFKENKKQRIQIKVVINFLIYVVSAKLIYSSVLSFYNGIYLFKNFYPDTFQKELTLYVLSMVIVVSFLTSIFAKNLQAFSLNKILIVIYAFVFNILITLTSSKLTTFQHIPKILSVSPTTTSEAWVDITITGKNFQELPFVGKVALAGEVQVENVHYWSNEKIIFRTNPNTTKTGDVCVITHSKGNSNCLPFSYNFGEK